MVKFDQNEEKEACVEANDRRSEFLLIFYLSRPNPRRILMVKEGKIT